MSTVATPVSAGLADIVRASDDAATADNKNVQQQQQLTASLVRADKSLLTNLSTPVQRESAALANLQDQIVDGTERLARDTQATLASLQRSSHAVDGFLTRYKQLQQFEQWLINSTERAEKIVRNLQATHEMLQT